MYVGIACSMRRTHARTRPVFFGSTKGYCHFNKLNLNPLCRRFNLWKLVKSPTRGNNILDQILTNMSDLYDKVLHLPPIGRSDHQCLLLAPKTRQKTPPPARLKETPTNETREFKCSEVENES